MSPKTRKKQKDKKKKKEKHDPDVDKKKKKKTKHEKKKRKRVDNFEKESEDGGSTSSNVMSNDSKCVATVQVLLDKRIAAPSVSNRTSGTSNTFSWGSAFAAAASLPQEELDEDFLRRTISTQEDEGLAKIATLAKEQHQKQSSPIVSPSSGNNDINQLPKVDVVEKVSDKKSKKKSKKKKKRKLNEASTQSVDVGTSSSPSSPPIDNAPLEGRMAKDPRHPGGDEQLMVLVDSKKGKVYSALDRNSDGDMIEIGKLVNQQVVIHNNIDALLPKDDENDDTEKKSSTTETNNDSDTQQVDFPYPTDPDDHCESPIEAYQDIAMLLKKLCGPNQKEDLSIYDPYYCNGGVIRNLQDIGYTNVYNKKEDCYEVWSTTSSKVYPEFDVFLTNPPYSDEHIPKLMNHLAARNSKFGSTPNRPWFLLMPNWVHRKDYYRNAIDQSGIRPFYLVPKKRYVYLPPKNFRDKKVSDVHKKSSPFVSMWYIWGGTQRKTDMLIDYYNKKLNSGSGAACDLARSTSALRDLRRKVKKNK